MNNVELIEPLRICRDCGKKAFTRDDLEGFCSTKKLPYGRANWCKECKAKYNWERDNPNKVYEERFSKRELHCTSCGFTPKTGDDLKLMLPNKRSPSGYSFKCLKCHNKEDWERKNPNKVYEERPYSDKYRVCTHCGLKIKYEDRDKYFVRRRNLCKECNKKEYNAYINSNKEQLEKRRLNARFYDKRVKKSTPSWLSKEEASKIRSLYTQAKYLTSITNVIYQVDHIYPITSNIMCGLNIFLNLQLLESSINNIKKNNLGYPEQHNVSTLHKTISVRAKPKEVFEALGSELSWEDFLDYEKHNFEESIYANK